MIRFHLGRWDFDFRAHKKDSSPPPAPDPYATAQAQTQANQQSAAYNAAMNRINTYTPLGSQTYTNKGIDPATGAPIYQEDISLSPEQQKLYDQQVQQNLGLNNIAQGMMGTVGSAYGTPIDTSKLQGLQFGANQPGLNFGFSAPQLNTNFSNLAGPLQTSLGQAPSNYAMGFQATPGASLSSSGLPNIPGQNDLAGFTKQAQDAAYQNATQYLDPQFSRQEEALKAQLANSGATEGSQAYNNAMNQFNEQKRAAYADARNSAVGQGLQEQQALYGMGANTRGQLFGERASSAGVQNQSAQMANESALANAGLQNSGINALWQRALDAGQFANQAQNQGFTQNLAALQAGNEAAGQQFGQNQALAAFGNQAAGQQFQMGQANAALNNATAQQQLQNLFALRNQPLNEFNALRSQAQVQMPTATPTYQPQTNAAPIGDYINQNYNAQMQAYNAQQQSNNSLMSGLFSLGSAGITAF